MGARSTIPVYPIPEWDTASPEDAGLDGRAISAAADLLGRPQSNARALVAARGGRIVCERYYEGHPPAGRLHLFSVTKSVVSALVGIALGEGKLESVEQRVVDFFPEAAVAAGNPLRLLTLRHLLTMTAGMAWPLMGHSREIMFERLIHSPDWTRFILSLPVRREQIGSFHYNSAVSHLLALILSRATGQTACAYAAERLFEPLGIAPVAAGVDWEADPQGNSTGGWGLRLTAREAARFGLLYLRGGTWNGQVIVPEEYARESTRMVEGAQEGYGYQWWLRRIHGERVFAAQGMGGQYVFCVPARDLLVVILSRQARRWPQRWEVMERLIASIGGQNG